MENRVWPNTVCLFYRVLAWQRLGDLHCTEGLGYEIVLRKLQDKKKSKFLIDAGFLFSKFPMPDAMQGHDKIYCLCYYSSFCIEPTQRDQTSLLSNTQVEWIKSWIM